MKITIIMSTRLFIIFPNLITKESYNWWVTRRVWGFRHQISKAIYLKISKTKYLKILVAHIGKLQETSRHCVKWLRNSPGKRYKRIRIRVTGEVETLSSPIRRQNFGCETSGCNGGGSRIPDVDIWVEWRRQPDSGCGHPVGMTAATGFRMWTSGWNGGGNWIPDVIQPGVKWQQPDGITTRVE